MYRFFLVFILFFNLIHSQAFTTNFQMKSSKYSSVIKDSIELEVFYESSISNDKNVIIKCETPLVLQIGKNFTKFIDFNTLKKDSLSEVFSHLETVGAKEMNLLDKYRILFKKNILKDLKSNTVYVQDRYSKVYQYDEVLPPLNWELKKETKELLGYNCRQAKMKFRGRYYTAWYTTEIPLFSGPYLFGGLPGLILQISDDEGEYGYTAIAIQKKKSVIYWRNEENIVKISREDFRKLQRNYFENPGFFIQGKAYDQSGNAIVPKLPSKPYNPIELE